MTRRVYHHRRTRAETVVWMLEELDLDAELVPVDLRAGQQKSAEVLALNPMGKVPVLVDGDVVVTETAAIGLYLADRYSLGALAPAPDDPARGPYLRWSLFGPSVVEPSAMMHAKGIEGRPGATGWGTYPDMLAALEHAIGEGPWILGSRFSMADVILGATVRFLLQFSMLEPRSALTEYAARLGARPALQRALARQAAGSA
jgi:glutathione S-transferase